MVVAVQESIGLLLNLLRQVTPAAFEVAIADRLDLDGGSRVDRVPFNRLLAQNRALIPGSQRRHALARVCNDLGLIVSSEVV